MSEIVISEIQIIPVKPKDGLVAFASCVINNWLYVGSIAIHSSPASLSGFRLVYPSKTLKNGTKLSICHPISKESGDVIQETIVSQYKELMEEVMKGNGKEAQETYRQL